MNKKIMFSITIVILIAIYLLTESQRDNRHIPSDDKVANVSEKEIPRLESAPLEKKRDKKIYEYTSLKSCEALVRESRNVWFNELRLRLDDYYQAYDLRILESALILLENPTLARKSVIRQSGKDKNYLIRASYLSTDMISDLLSLEELLFFSSLSSTQLSSLAAERGLLINEVSLAIKSDRFTEAQIFNLMAALVDINGHTLDIYRKSEEVTLLDAIVDYREDSLFQKYTELGGKVPNVEIGVNPLERLLVGNGMGGARLDKPIPKKMLADLVQQGLPLRGQKTSADKSELFIGAFDTVGVRDLEKFERVLSEYNLILSEAPTLNQLKNEPAIRKTFSDLRQAKSDFFMKQFNVDIDGVEHCYKILLES